MPFRQLTPCPQALASRSGLPLSWRLFCRVSSEGLVVWCFWEAPALSKQGCCSLVPANPSAFSPLSTLGLLTSNWLPPSSSSLWLAEKTGKEEEEGYLRHKVLRLCPVYQLLYHPIQEVAVYQWRTMFQQGTCFIPICSAGKVWKSNNCDLLKSPQKRRSLH